MRTNKSQFNRNRDGGILADALIILAVGTTIFGILFGYTAIQSSSEQFVEEPDHPTQLRKMFLRLQKEIVKADRLQIGDHFGGPFQPTAVGAAQNGSAIRIFRPTERYEFVEYRMRTLDGRPYLQRIEAMNERMINSSMICTYVAPSTPLFTLKDATGQTVLRLDDAKVVALAIGFRSPDSNESAVAESTLRATIPYQSDAR